MCENKCRVTKYTHAATRVVCLRLKGNLVCSVFSASSLVELWPQAVPCMLFRLSKVQDCRFHGSLPHRPAVSIPVIPPDLQSVTRHIRIFAGCGRLLEFPSDGTFRSSSTILVSSKTRIVELPRRRSRDLIASGEPTRTNSACASARSKPAVCQRSPFPALQSTN